MKPPVVKHLRYKPGFRYLHFKRCEAEVHESTARWRTFANKDTRCELGSLFEVDGHAFCKRHAGDYLIQALVSGEIMVAGKRTDER